MSNSSKLGQFNAAEFSDNLSDRLGRYSYLNTKEDCLTMLLDLFLILNKNKTTLNEVFPQSDSPFSLVDEKQKKRKTDERTPATCFDPKQDEFEEIPSKLSSALDLLKALPDCILLEKENIVASGEAALEKVNEIIKCRK